ncbi:isomerase [Kitasatospora sp. NBC_00240]|uniref:5-carboxymethyl-2-hydroxymuconate Delta-isomerase n=1 Tax=Kitasatospora sp. NBC_00240 TaxID=2903567 RepID=UPI0022569C07|nr:isomerase [Kitasatospora sp. NBC_00240]MCX5209228.1 isomerase [Kitasatospora sp. NBC_00240]
MPQISVDYSANLADTFDRQALGLALNQLAVKYLAAAPDACRTRFRRVDETVVVGERAEGQDLVLVDFPIFPGRSPEAKAGLSEAVLALLAEHLPTAPGRRLHTAVNVVDIDSDSYRGTTLDG